MRAEEFLQNYRVLEDLLDARLARDGRKHASVVMDYLQMEESEPFRERLDLCREIRNLLSHNANSDGSAVIEPSEEILRSLKEIVEELKRPLTALLIATPAKALLTAKPHYQALRLMNDMQTQGFSHVPILEDGRFLGVFSVSTVFSYLTVNPGATITGETRLQELRAFLPTQRHMTERFLFVGEDATYPEIKKAFERGAIRHKRLAAIFVTETGDEAGRLLGMITPWDVLGRVHDAGTLMA